MYDELARLQHESDRLQSNDPSLFTNVPIDPEIFRLEHEFCVSQKGGLSQIQVSDEEDEGEDSKEAGSDTSECDSISPPQSVASIDSIQENTDFVFVE
jgi:hypothetical protein